VGTAEDVRGFTASLLTGSHASLQAGEDLTLSLAAGRQIWEGEGPAHSTGPSEHFQGVSFACRAENVQFTYHLTQCDWALDGSKNSRACTLLICSCGLEDCGYLGHNQVEGLMLGRIPRKVTQMILFTISLFRKRDSRGSPISQIWLRNGW
jgi:hypothetical protein